MEPPKHKGIGPQYPKPKLSELKNLAQLQKTLALVTQNFAGWKTFSFMEKNEKEKETFGNWGQLLHHDHIPACANCVISLKIEEKCTPVHLSKKNRVTFQKKWGTAQWPGSGGRPRFQFRSLGILLDLLHF